MTQRRALGNHTAWEKQHFTVIYERQSSQAGSQGLQNSDVFLM